VDLPDEQRGQDIDGTAFEQHQGNALAIRVFDIKPKYSKQLSYQSIKVCPGAWALLGEHSFPKEPSRQTAARGVREELQISVWFQTLTYTMMKGDDEMSMRDSDCC